MEVRCRWLLVVTLVVLLSCFHSVTAQDVTCPAIADIILILDESTNIVAAKGGYDNWNSIIGFATSIASSFPISPKLTQIGLMKFGSNVNIQFYLNTYNNSADLKTAIGNLEIKGGETDTADALMSTRTVMFSPQNGAREGIPHVAILITDGRADVNADQTITQANLTKAAGVEIFTIGITNQVNVTQLVAIASYPPETHFYYVSDYSQLNTILNNLIANTCNNLQTITSTLPSTTTTITKTTTSAAQKTFPTSTPPVLIGPASTGTVLIGPTSTPTVTVSPSAAFGTSFWNPVNSTTTVSYPSVLNSTAIIVGVVIGFLFLVAVIIIIIVLLCRKRNGHAKEQEKTYITPNLENRFEESVLYTDLKIRTLDSRNRYMNGSSSTDVVNENRGVRTDEQSSAYTIPHSPYYSELSAPYTELRNETFNSTNQLQQSTQYLELIN